MENDEEDKPRLYRMSEILTDRKPGVLWDKETKEIILLDTNLPHFKYEIPLTRIETRAKLIDWIHHLSGKKWVTTYMIGEFISVVYAANDWDLYGTNA